MSEQRCTARSVAQSVYSQVRCLWMALVKAEQPSLPIVMERSRTILVCEFRNHDFLRSVPLHAYASLKKVTGGNDSVTASDLTWNHVYYV
jgi:hypothetical protein